MTLMFLIVVIEIQICWETYPCIIVLARYRDPMAYAASLS